MNNTTKLQIFVYFRDEKASCTQLNKISTRKATIT